MKLKVKDLCKIGLVCALYIVLSLLTNFLNLGGVSIRISEFLLFLVLIDYRYGYGIVIGTAITNLICSPLQIYDVIFGTIATILSIIFISLIKNKSLSFIFPTIFNGLIIGLEYYLILGYPFWLSFIEVAFFELITVLIGQKIYYSVLKDNNKLKELLIINNIEK